MVRHVTGFPKYVQSTGGSPPSLIGVRRDENRIRTNSAISAAVLSSGAKSHKHGKRQLLLDSVIDSMTGINSVCNTAEPAVKGL